MEGTMATRELQVAVRRRAGVAIIDLAGDVDCAAEQALQRAYDDASAQARAIVLDFSRTEYVNSTGIALIVGLLAQARARSVPMAACGLSDHYRRIFEITRLADFMTIADDEDAALGVAERGDHA
jgi:anti-anti-sigma factor